MIAKVIPSGNSGNSMAFARMVNYITNRANESMEQIVQGNGHKVEWVEVTHCLSDDIDLAIAEVRAIQDLNQRAQHKSYHFVLSFPEGEQPSNRVIREAEQRAVEALGFESHQRVSALHGNTDNVHLHVVVNMIDTESLKVHNPYLDYMTLDRVAGEIEREYSLQSDNRTSRVAFTEGQQQDHEQGRGQENREKAEVHVLPDAARFLEKHTGKQSFVGWVREHAKSDLMDAMKSDDASWDSLQATAEKYDLCFKPRGAGMVIASRTQDFYMKASDLDRSFSRGKLEARLGPGSFQNEDFSKTISVPEKTYQPGQQRDPQAQPLYIRYQQAMADIRSRRAEQLRFSRRNYHAQKLELKQSYRKERANTPKRLRSDQGHMNRKHQRYLERHGRLKSRYQDQRDLAFNRFATQSWQQWLCHQALKGNQEAKAYLNTHPLKSSQELPGRIEVLDRFDHPIRVSRHRDPLSGVDYEMRPDGSRGFKLSNGARMAQHENSFSLLNTSSDESLTPSGLLETMQWVQKASRGDTLLIGGRDDVVAVIATMAVEHDIPVKFKDEGHQAFYDELHAEKYPPPPPEAAPEVQADIRKEAAKQEPSKSWDWFSSTPKDKTQEPKQPKPKSKPKRDIEWER